MSDVRIAHASKLHKNSLGRLHRHDIRQYMKSENPCEKDVNNSRVPSNTYDAEKKARQLSAPFPSLLESAEQKRRVERNRGIKFVRQSICGLIEG